MENVKQAYQAPELKELGAVVEITQSVYYEKDYMCGSVVDICVA